ncbi:MAG: BrnT family toxin [Candidatus Accumulibacter sp.]|jgi:uncharacterized DUF497 family protein|nr:BrnT family toxin [Accumulibacter sp.]
MEIEFDSAKDALNRQKHGVSLAIAREMEWDDADILPDTRFPYDEERMVAVVPLGERLFFVAFVDRGEKRRRVFSIRPATRKEVNAYVGNR